MTVRSLADLPNEVLDERMRRERDAAHLVSRRIISCLIFLAVNAMFVSVAVREEGATITFSYNNVAAIFFTVTAVLIGVPSVVVAWRHSSR